MNGARRYHLIINPAAGVARAPGLVKSLENEFARAGCEVSIVQTEYAGHARELARSLPLRDRDGLCALGGDGTLHELVNGLLTREDGEKIPIGMLPAGTGNALMRELGCLDPIEAVARIARRRPRALDVMRVKSAGRTRFSFNLVGWGLLASANAAAERLRWLGRRRYDVAALIEVVRARRFRGQLRVDGELKAGNFNVVLGCNSVYTGVGMKIAPQAVFDDGLVDVMWTRDLGRLAVLDLFRRVFTGGHMSCDALERTRAREFSLEMEDYPLVNIDGELVEMGALEVTVVPGAVEILN